MVRISTRSARGLLAHEVMHPAMQHHTRRGDRDPGLWNEAADYAINPILTDAGFVLPGAPLLDRAYCGMTAEQIYEALRKSQDDAGSRSPGDSDTEDTGNGDSLKDEDGGGKDAPEDRADENSEAVGQPGGVLDAPDPAQQEAEWQVALKQASQAAQMMGQLPGGISLAVDDVLRPPSCLEVHPPTLRTAVSWRRLFMANAEPPVLSG